MQALAMDLQNPFQSSIQLFEGSSRIINAICNDYFKEQLKGTLNSISISSFILFIQNKYPSESDSIILITDCFDNFNRVIHQNQIMPTLCNLKMFAEHQLRHSEILLRLSSQNTSTSQMPLKEVSLELEKKSKWIDNYYKVLASEYSDRDFRPLVDNFYEANRIDPFDLTATGLSNAKDFCKTKTIAFDTAFNCSDMYKQRLQFIPPVQSSKIQNDIDYVLSLCNKEDYAIVRKNVKSRFVSKPSNLYEAINDYMPFIETAGYYYTNANLVSRFITNITSEACEKYKRYLIHSGFLFEKRMKEEFNKNKFVLIDIKRTKTHREFDVILKNKQNSDIINIQCKNFAINLYQYREDVSFAQKRLSRVMKRLDAALAKEIGRESALRQELQRRNISFNTIKHIVVSKQQIPSNDDIMDYSHFMEKYGNH